MNSLVGALLRTLIISYSIGRSRTELTLSQLESKIYNGKDAQEGTHEYMASLQLEGHHICSSGIIADNLLISSGQCVEYIESKIKHTAKLAWALLGHVELNKGERYDIQNLMYHPSYIHVHYLTKVKTRDYDYDVGIVMLKHNINNAKERILPLFKTDMIGRNIRVGVVSGWGSVNPDDVMAKLGSACYSETLHYMHISFRNMKTCRDLLRGGNFVYSQICGEGEKGNEKITLGDIGSPLMSFLPENGTFIKYIIGITTGQGGTDNLHLTRFIKVNSVHVMIDKMIAALLKGEKIDKSDLGKANKLRKC